MDQETVNKIVSLFKREAFEIGENEGADMQVSLVSGPSDEGFEIKIVGTKSAYNRKQAEFASKCKRYGFEPEDYGKTFLSRGRAYKITEINTRRPKYPLSATRVDSGKGYKFSCAATNGWGVSRKDIID